MLSLPNKNTLSCFSRLHWRWSIQIIYLLVGISRLVLSYNRTQFHQRLFSPLNIPFIVVIMCGIWWFRVSFQNISKPLIKISGTSSPCRDNQKGMVENYIVYSSYLFPSSEFYSNRSFSEIFPIKRRWFTVNASSCLLITPILHFATRINIENHLLDVESVDAYMLLSFDE